jgi:hypothetical protein
VDAAVAGGLGHGGDAQLVEQGAHLTRSLLHHGECDPGRRVEVDAQLVGVLGIGGLRGPHMETETAEVHRPQHVGEVGRDQRLRGGSVRGADDGRLQPLGVGVRHPLLEEGRPPGTVGEALEQHRPPSHGPQQRLLDGLVVADEVELGVTALGEEHLARAGDRQLAPGCLDNHRVVHHHPRP